MAKLIWVLPAFFLCMLSACGHGGSSVIAPIPQANKSSALGSPLNADAFAPTSTTVQRHVLTWEYFADSSPPASWSKMAPMLDWAVVTGAQSSGARSAGLKTMMYTNPNRQAPGGSMYTSDELTFAHDCNNHRVTFPRHPGTFLMDPSSTHLHHLWRQAVLSASATFDAILEDAAVSVAGVTSVVPCNFSQTAWDNATNGMDASLGRPIVENSKLGRSGNVTTVALGLALNPTTIGGMSEECYSNQNSVSAKPRGDVWKATENTEIKFWLAGKIFICRGDGTALAASAQDERTYMLASFLLTYSPGSSIISEHWPTPSTFEVEPESRLVPLKPIVPPPVDVSTLEISLNVYGREYAACYVNGQFVGPCAVAVNIDAPSIAHPFPWPGKYRHTVVLHGADLLDGGTMSINGPAPAAQIPGDDAVVVFQ